MTIAPAIMGPLLTGQAPADSRGLRLQQISDNFGGHAIIPVQWVLIAAGLLMLVMAGLSLRVWWQTRHERSSPLSVFNKVAGDCGLTPGERLMLWRIARRRGLASPLTLMVSPTTLRHHARASCEHRGSGRRVREMRRVAALRRKLFAEDFG